MKERSKTESCPWKLQQEKKGVAGVSKTLSLHANTAAALLQMAATLGVHEELIATLLTQWYFHFTSTPSGESYFMVRKSLSWLNTLEVYS